jgi:tRNA-2-methylthio-N6-dimethylallyladenosine synthase/ribosomal protein S12 methylthiotransferase
MYPSNSRAAKPSLASFAVHCISLGCPKNRVDTERMLASLGPFHLVDDAAQAEIILINTCGFIAPAIRESTRTILETASRILGVAPRPLLVVAGCLVSRFGSELREALPEVDLWLGVHEASRLPEKISAFLQKKIRPLAAPGGRILRTMPSYAYLKIAEGCNHRCRFCTIPFIRGKLASTPVPALLDEARAILDQGVGELILVAQDLTSYGRDFGLRHGLETLLGNLHRLPGLRWLRLMYLYPAGLTSRLLRFLADLGPPLLPYFDLPLQHAHPEILAAMGRPFVHDPRLVVDRIRRHFSKPCLRTSLIVGFPGERPRHFKVLYDFVAQIRFNHLGVFSFCPEPGTPAATMPGQVGIRAKARRREKLMTLQTKISAEILAEYRDQDMDVLVDRPSPEWPGLFEGRVWFQTPEADGSTYVSGEDVRPGRMVLARIQDTQTYDLSALA